MSIPKKRKLGPKTVDCINLGYAKNSVGYIFLVVKSEVPDQKVGTIMESKDATFFEDTFPMRDMQSTSRQESEETPEPAIPMEYYEQTHDENPEEDDEETLGRGNKKRKLGPKTVDCINLGYAKNSVGYIFLVVKSEVPDQKVGTIMESKDATFFEDTFPMRDMQSTSRQESEETPEPAIPMEYYEQTHDENPEEDDEETLGRGKRQRTAKTFGDDFFVYLVDDTPTSISEAYASPEADYWKDAVRSEMDSIMANGTWEITDRPYGCKPLGCKWVFKKKLRPDGTIEKYKARLVAKGYAQKEEEDFFDTYSPVARLTTIRVLLSLAASHGLLVHQMDVKAAFLNGELNEEIYMQ